MGPCHLAIYNQVWQPMQCQSAAKPERYYPLSKNVEAFVNALCFNIDKATAGENALARLYRKAIERCLRQIKKMSKEEFIAMLENEVDARMSKAVLISLMEEVPDDE